MHVVLDGNIDDNSGDTRKLLQRLTEIHATVSDRKWEIRCGRCTYLGPWAASIFYAAKLVGDQQGQSPRIKLPGGPAALSAYCKYSGMSHLFSGGPEPEPDHPASETVPLSLFLNASWNLPDGIVRLIQRHRELPDESEDRLRTCIQEVTQNVVDHAKSPIGGVMSARYFSHANEVRVGIVDRGVGVGASLKTRHPEITGSFLALNRIIKGGISAMSRQNNMGLGVSNLFQLIALAKGRIAVFSYDAMAEAHGSVPPQVEELPFIFPGTGVFFSLPLGPVGEGSSE